MDLYGIPDGTVVINCFSELEKWFLHYIKESNANICVNYYIVGLAILYVKIYCIKLNICDKANAGIEDLINLE